MRFLLLFTVYCLLFTTQAQNAVDERLLLNIYQNNNASFKQVMHFAERTSVPVFAGVPLIVGGIALAKPTYRQDAYLLIASQVTSAAVMQGLKSMLKRKRPYQEMQLQGVFYEHDITRTPTSDSYSMPSGHSTVSFSIATSLTLQSKKWYVAVPAYGYATAVALSRVYDGKHYPSDVAAGAVLGTGITLLVHRYADKLTPKFVQKNALQINPQSVGISLTKRF